MTARMSDWIPSLESVFKRFLESPSYRPMKRRELAAALGLPAPQRRKLRELLRRMRERGELVVLRNNRWARPDPARRRTGTLHVDGRGRAMVVCDGADGLMVRVEAAEVQALVHGDRVAVELTGRPAAGRDRVNGRVVAVLDRPRPRLPGLLRRGHGYWYVIPTHRRHPSNVRIRAFVPGVDPVEGHIVSARLDPWAPGQPGLMGIVEEDLGRPRDPGIESRQILRRLGLADEFPPAALTEARRISRRLTPADLDGRRDYRDQNCFTIDPPDARDFDDAVAISRLSDGGWEVWVHIADVAHYVPTDSAVDLEARERGTSVYLADRAVTMLPPDLTVEVCSLCPGEDRLCHTVHVVLDSSGRPIQEETHPSCIRSRARLDYESVQAWLDGGDPATVPDGVRNDLLAMADLAALLRRRRLACGALAFTLPEARCEIDDTGRTVAVRRRAADRAYSLIEELMLLANRAVARRLARARVPAIYRIHEEPDERQWENMAAALAELRLGPPPTDRASLNALLERVAGTDLEHVAAMTVLRHLKRAEYSTRCGDHFGLAFRPYTHFTSPIRRYPDLAVHRILVAIERGGLPPVSHLEADRIARHSSEMERLADEAEWESLDAARVAFYRALLDRGETGPWPAIAVGRTPRGVLVEVMETLQRGMVPSDLLRHDPSIGSRLDVRLVAVEPHRRQVTFAPAGPPFGLRHGRDRRLGQRIR